MLLLLLQTNAGSPGHSVPAVIPDLTTLMVARIAALRDAAPIPPTLDSTTLLRAELDTVHADTDSQQTDLNTDFGRVRG